MPQSRRRRNNFGETHVCACNCPAWWCLPVGPEGTPTLKEATLPSTTAPVRGAEGGAAVVGCSWRGVRVTSSRIALIVTDAINRNLHSSQCDAVGTRLLRFVPENYSAEEPSVVQKCKDKRALHCFSSAFFFFKWKWSRLDRSRTQMSPSCSVYCPYSMGGWGCFWMPHMWC